MSQTPIDIGYPHEVTAIFHGAYDATDGRERLAKVIDTAEIATDNIPGTMRARWIVWGTTWSEALEMVTDEIEAAQRGMKSHIVAVEVKQVSEEYRL